MTAKQSDDLMRSSGEREVHFPIDEKAIEAMWPEIYKDYRNPNC